MTANVVISPVGIQQFFANNGAPCAGGTVLTQVASVNYPTYQDSAGATPLPNPIPLNSRGEVSNASGVSSQLFLEVNKVYTFTLYDAAGNQLNQSTYVQGPGQQINIYPTSASGSPNALVLTSTPAIGSYALGQEFIVSAPFTNTGAMTVNIDSIGPVYVQLNGFALTGGEFLNQGGYRLVCDGTGFQLEPVSASGVISSFVGLCLYGGTGGGTANAQTITVSGSGPTYLVTKAGQRIIYKAGATNTGAATMNINSLGTKAIQLHGAALTGGEIVSGHWVELLYDGTVWQMVEWSQQQGSGITFATAGIFQNSWSGAYAIANSYQVPIYYKDSLGFVHLSGVASSGTTTPGTAIAQLPANQGLYPSAAIGFACTSASAFGAFTVDTSGNIAIRAGSATSFGLDGATWFGVPGT